MKRQILNVLTFGLFTAGIFFSVSENDWGQISFIGKSQAELKNYEQPLQAICPDGKTTITVCGSGLSSCYPIGVCPGM